MEIGKELIGLVPEGPGRPIDWDRIRHSGLGPLIKKMEQTLQDPVWHGEGDVWTHTRMVCEKLVSLAAYKKLGKRVQQELFVAALLHDIGKIPCTRMEEGRWTSPNHTAVGARMARELLWLTYGFCGTKQLQEFRETVCALIRYHSVPPHILDQKEPERRLIKIAANGRLIPDFSIALLCLLEEADVGGRLSDSVESARELLEFCTYLAEEADCRMRPARFPTDYSEHAYLAGRNILPGQELYDDTWGEVVLMAGLPGTGKDTWIREHYGDCPVVSLDDIRKEMKIPPTAPQGAVVSAARDQAREYLRKKVPFVWNATSLTPVIREKQLRLFADYGASARIVYLETGWEEQMRRNRERKAAVPEPAIGGMLKNLVPPERFEAQRVEWHCV